MAFDPREPLPGAPEPWAPSSMPIVRAGPPFAMTEMIAAEPAVAERIAARLADDRGVQAAATLVREAAVAGRPVVATGCGTSEHAAMVAAALVADALRTAGLPGDRVASVQAFELAGSVPSDGVVVGISHEGGTWATNLALERARAAGAGTILITVGPGSPGAALADHLLLTGEQDQSWCHTVGYLSPIVAASVLAAAIRGQRADSVATRALLDAADHEPAAEESARMLARCRRLLVAGSGVDYAAARELALKVEEGAHLPATAYQLETVRHGHLAAADESAGMVLILTDGEDRGGELVQRAVAVLRSAAALAMPAAAILTADLDDDVPLQLTPAGRAAVPLAGDLPRLLSCALGSAIPLQLLTERLARGRDVNPDTLGREDSRQAAAADA
ncbi:MAG TPA: SIS domain-containing protein [Candidatus Limnocylindria bacterium]|nr:SIS domain-containing protein [Candidatus Limnocylindria bacterium]